MPKPLICHTASHQHCCCTRPYQKTGRISFTTKHRPFCHLISLISLHRPCFTVNQNVLFTEIPLFSRKSLFQICFNGIQIIEKCFPGSISLINNSCLTIFHRRPVQAEAMTGQCPGIYKFRKIYSLSVNVLRSVINTFCILVVAVK